ncbi:MAG: hypothetical protein FWG90_02425 [Oscillospiraceae bacterium]|nr:hypothetical protein [Oscillospiraceae bacterium]
MKISEAKYKANNEYIAKSYDRIELKVKKGRKEIIKGVAEKQGKSLNGYINDLIDKDLVEYEKGD